MYVFDPRWYLEGSSKIGSVCPSGLQSVHLSARFLGIVSLVFSKFWHVARNPYKDMRNRAGFSEKFFFWPQKLGKWTKNGPEKGLFEFIEKFGN